MTPKTHKHCDWSQSPSLYHLHLPYKHLCFVCKMCCNSVNSAHMFEVNAFFKIIIIYLFIFNENGDLQCAYKIEIYTGIQCSLSHTGWQCNKWDPDLEPLWVGCGGRGFSICFDLLLSHLHQDLKLPAAEVCNKQTNYYQLPTVVIYATPLWMHLQLWSTVLWKLTVKYKKACICIMKQGCQVR